MLQHKWDEFHKDFKPKHLKKVSFWPSLFSQQAYERLADDLIKRFGLSDLTEKIMNLEADLELLEIDLALTGDRMLVMEIKMKQIDLKELKDKQEEINSKNKGWMNTLSTLEKLGGGFRIDPLKVTMYEFNSRLHSIENG